MKRSSVIPVIVAAALLAGCLIAFYATRGAGNSTAPAKPQRAAAAPLVDNSLLQTARRVSAFADSAEEQQDAREALRLSDHELDQAYATALRQAVSAAPPTGPAKQLEDRISQLKDKIDDEKDRAAELTKKAETSDAAADQLEIVQAQQALDEDDLEDAQQDLARTGGDRHARLEQALQQHEASQQQPPPLPTLRFAVPEIPPTLFEQARMWFSLTDRSRQVDAALAEAGAHNAARLSEHEVLEKQADLAASSGGGAANAAADTESTVARLHRMSGQRKDLSDLDKRIQDLQQLEANYQKWSDAIAVRRAGVLHVILGSLAIILGAVFAAILLVLIASRALGQHSNQRRANQLRAMVTVGIEVLAVLAILLVIFGPPTQLTTILGLATAGLTVALKDFIMAFFGWFLLMGRNGLHVGDWVEIEGVGGEVIEIGLLKTVLLEMGNWTANGHPTGRRVAFMNGFALEGHFFNFSTAGQWLWDELAVTVPSGTDPYRIAEQIASVVSTETEEEARSAEQEWQRVTAQYGVREFSGKPAVDLRPGVNGLDVNVRYITRAPQRYQVKSRLFEKIVEVLQPNSVKPQEQAEAAAPQAAH